MRKLTYVVSSLMLIVNTSNAQDIKAFYIGHSLSDGVIDMVHSLSSLDDSVDFTFRYQTIPGSPLRWNWQAKDRDDYVVNNPFYCGFYHEDYGLPSAEFTTLVLTESVPRFLSIIDDTYQYADSFVNYALTFNPSTQIYIYEVWHCIKSATPNPCDYDIPASNWRQRLTDDLPMWESVVDTLNNRYNPTIPICLIPVGQGLAALYDSIVANVIPGITSIEDLFDDDIDVNDIGKYFIACIHFATIHKKSPVGLSNQLQNMWGTPYSNSPTNTQAQIFQEIAWKIANEYPKSCIDNQLPPTSVNNINNVNIFEIYPNPVEDYLKLKYVHSNVLTQNNEYQVLDATGRKCMEGTGNTIDVRKLSNGIYFIKSRNVVKKFYKK